MTNMEKITESFSFAKGGRVVENAVAQLTPDTDYVFIALGGAGMETLSLIKTGIVRGCRVPGTSSVHYLAIDTDGESLRTFADPARVSVPFTENECVFLTPVENAETRQTGRYRFASSENFGRVRSALEGIKLNTYPNRVLKVCLISSLGGSTGSGAFIDLAYLIRDVFCINSNVGHNSLKGYLYLPDVRDFRDTPIRRQHNYANGFAALKELDYYMSLQNQRIGFATNPSVDDALSPCYSFTYPDGMPVRSSDKIFDRCTLISGADTVGRHVRREDATVETTASDILGECIKTSGENDISLCCWDRDVPWSFPADVTEPHRDRYPLNARYQYAAFGYAETRLPMQECCAYALKWIFEAANELFVVERNLFRENHGWFADNMLSECGLSDTMVLERILTENAAFMTCAVGNVSRPQYVDLKREQAHDDDLFKSEWDRFEGALEKTISGNYQEAVWYFVDKLSQSLYHLFHQNPFRAFYVLNVVDEREVAYPECLIGRVKVLLAGLDVQKSDALSMRQKAETQYSEAKDMYDHANLIQRGGARRALFDKAEALARAKYNLYLCEAQIKALREIVDGLMQNYDRYFKVYTKVFEMFSGLMNDIGSYVTDARTQTTGASSLFSYDAAPLYAVTNNRAAQERHERLISHIDEVVAKMDMEKFVREFMAKLQSRREDWFELLEADAAAKNDLLARNVENADVKIYGLVKSIQAFFNQFYEELAQLTLEDYLIIAYREKGMTEDEAIKAAAEDIIQALSARSEPLFRTGADYSLSDDLEGLSFRAVCVPAKADRLRDAMKECLTKDGPRVRLYDSSSTDTVSFFTNYCCLPVFILREIDEMKAAYQKTLEWGECGLHSDENPGGRDWTLYPLIPPGKD